MIVSETPNRVNSRWLQACVLLCAVVVLPLGMVYAQDYEAVGKRLRAAVEAGELTGEQARAMLGTLRKADGATKDQDSDRVKDYLAKVKKELGAAVEAGKISEEDAKKRYQGAEKAIKERMAGARGEGRSRTISRERYARVEADLKKLVAEGKISKEGMVARLNGMRKMMAGQGERQRGGERKRISREDFAKAAGEIRQAIAAGKITEKEGRAKLDAMRKMIGEKSEGDARKRSREGDAKRGVDWEGIKKRIEGAVKSGDMTREEADAKYKEIRERMAGRRDR